jgi:plasmid stabilization system protein ParE
VSRDVVILAAAQADIRRTTLRIARTSFRSSGVEWHDRILAKIQSLARHPQMWPLAEEADDLGIPLRQALFGKRRQIYRILYTFDATTVYIHRVRHAAQDRLTLDDI